jgi:hypothetical protein
VTLPLSLTQCPRQLPPFPGTRSLAEVHQQQQSPSTAHKRSSFVQSPTHSTNALQNAGNVSREQRRRELEEWLQAVCKAVGTSEPYFGLIAGKREPKRAHSSVRSCFRD